MFFAFFITKKHSFSELTPGSQTLTYPRKCLFSSNGQVAEVCNVIISLVKVGTIFQLNIKSALPAASHIAANWKIVKSQIWYTLYIEGICCVKWTVFHLHIWWERLFFIIEKDSPVYCWSVVDVTPSAHHYYKITPGSPAILFHPAHP